MVQEVHSTNVNFPQRVLSESVRTADRPGPLLKAAQLNCYDWGICMSITNIILVNDACYEHSQLDHPVGTDGPMRSSHLATMYASNGLMMPIPVP